MVNGIRANDPHGSNKERGLVHIRVRQETPEEGQKTYRLTRCEYSNEDEDDSPRTLNDKNYQASSHKFRQLTYSTHIYICVIQSSSNELSNLVSVNPKCKQVKADT